MIEYKRILLWTAGVGASELLKTLESGQPVSR